MIDDMDEARRLIREIPSINVTGGYYINVTPEVTPADLHRLLEILEEWRADFDFCDPVYPSPSDPGVSMSYTKVGAADGYWRLWCGSHGWSSGYFDVPNNLIVRELHNVIVNHGVSRFTFRRQRKSDDSAVNDEQMQALLARLHPPVSDETRRADDTVTR